MGTVIAYMLMAAVVVLIALAYVSAQANARLRRVRSTEVLELLAIVVGRNLPLERSLGARSNAGDAQGCYARIQRSLEAGTTLSYALQRGRFGVESSVLNALRAAERAGSLRTVLPALARDARCDLRARNQGRALPLWYPILMLAVLTAALTYTFVFVLPKLAEIGADFGIAMPTITQRVTEIVGWLLGVSPLVMGLVLLLIAGEVAVRLVRQKLRRYMPTPTDLLRHGLGPLRRIALPGRYATLARQLTVLHAGLRAGHTLDAAAKQAAAVDAYGRQGAVMAVWAERLRQGAPPRSAATAAGLPASFVRVLVQAEQGGDLESGLEWLQGYYQRLSVHWRQVIAGVLSPVLVVACALLVAACALALFMPLIALLEATVESVQ